MDQIDVHEYTRQLVEQYGSQALVIAARKANSLEEAGEVKQALDWRRIEAALKVTQDPHES